MSEQANNGGNAFPQPDTYHANGQIEYGSTGMTLRDYFAAKALPPLIMKLNYEGLLRKQCPEDYEMYAAVAYELADAMLKAREVKP